MMEDYFRKFSHQIASLVGKPAMFVTAVGVVLTWALLGPMYGYSDTWQLVINTGTTIVTFLIVFLIQNTQNRDSREFQLKLDELIRSNKHARNQLINLANVSEKELDQIHDEFCRVHAATEEKLNQIRDRKGHMQGQKPVQK